MEERNGVDQRIKVKCQKIGVVHGYRHSSDNGIIVIIYKWTDLGRELYRGGKVTMNMLLNDRCGHTHIVDGPSAILSIMGGCKSHSHLRFKVEHDCLEALAVVCGVDGK